MLSIGCPMWGYKEWIGDGRLFPPKTRAGDFLKLYSRKLTCVEGNTTFYALPSEETIIRWRDETPETFTFCPKVSRSISHEGLLTDHKSETLRFIQRMQLLRSRLGPIFLQLPPTFTPERLPELAAFLEFWPPRVQLAVEVRHPAFFVDQSLNTLLRRHHVGRVVMDTRPIQEGPKEEQDRLQKRERKPHLPVERSITTDFAFLRYIGHPRMEMNEPFLDEWALQIGQWITQGIRQYIFCHCPFEEHSPELCVELYRRVMTKAPLPPLPGTGGSPDKEKPEQIRLF